MGQNEPNKRGGDGVMGEGPRSRRATTKRGVGVCEVAHDPVEELSAEIPFGLPFDTGTPGSLSSKTSTMVSARLL